MRKGRERLKGDERILGDSSFVLEVIEATEEQFNRKYELKSKGYTFENLAGRVSSLFEIEPEDIFIHKGSIDR